MMTSTKHYSVHKFVRIWLPICDWLLKKHAIFTQNIRVGNDFEAGTNDSIAAQLC